jgi:hypothetical protein
MNKKTSDFGNTRIGQRVDLGDAELKEPDSREHSDIEDIDDVFFKM